MKTPFAVLVVLTAFLAVGCQKATDSVPAPISQNLSVSVNDMTSGQSRLVEGSSVDAIDQTRNWNVSVALPAASLNPFVYVLFTNVANDVSLRSPGSVSGSRDLAPPPPVRTVSPMEAAEPLVRPRIELSSLRSLDFEAKRSTSRSLQPAETPTNPTYTLGQADTFVDSFWGAAGPQTSNRHTMHLKVVKEDATAGRTLYVWVTDDSFVGSAADIGTLHKVTLAMAEALALKFLDPDTPNDIYGYVTAMLGTEWFGAGLSATTKDGLQYTDLLGGTGRIHIVLADLNPTADPAQRYFGGGLQGYFHSWNNAIGYGSNERVLFAIDANSLANPDSDGNKGTVDATPTWSLESSYYPNDVVSTLAHEFQHMIQFYQKNVRNNQWASGHDWFNEMASMAVEDLVADKLGVQGPRGLPGSQYTTLPVAPDVGIRQGRLPMFNGTHESVPLQAWPQFGSGNPLPNYANAYAFGAWLTRNYGGPAFWRDVVQSAAPGIQAVIDAVNQHGGVGETYASLVRKWGQAVLFLSSTQVPMAYASAEAGAGFAFDAVGGVIFKTGSINLANYYRTDADGFYYKQGEDYLFGPSIWPRPPTSGDTLGAGATWIWSSGQTSGTWSRTITLPPYIAATVVVATP